MKTVRKICNVCKKDVIREGHSEYCACYLYYHERDENGKLKRMKKRLCLDCAKVLKEEDEIRCDRCKKAHDEFEERFNLQSDERRLLTNEKNTSRN